MDILIEIVWGKHFIFNMFEKLIQVCYMLTCGTAESLAGLRAEHGPAASTLPDT